jgi:FkbM family methyltransferase
MYRSQIGQDRILNEQLFKGRKGVFCDVGAHDGISGSNSYFFEKELGWTGVCVEAKPENFQLLQKNRASHLVNGAAYNRGGEVTFTSNEGWTNMLSGIEEAYNPLHLERINREIKQYGGQTQQITVPCYTLSSIFDQHNLKTIDYLSIDTEGSELQVLEGVDFTQVHINVVNFEVNYPCSKEHRQIQELLTKNGFDFWLRVEFDEVWLNSTLKFSWEN